MNLTKDQKMKIIIAVLVGIIIMMWLGKIPAPICSPGGSSGSSSGNGNPVEGTCSDGSDYVCTTTCTSTPKECTPPTTPPNEYKCCLSSLTESTLCTSERTCPTGLYLKSSGYTSETECLSQCRYEPTTPTTPTDEHTCRDYSTDLGYSGSSFSADTYNSLSACQYYVYNNWCSAPTQVNVLNGCCMWSC